MLEKEINTSFAQRQRFEFICPPERTVEARALLEENQEVRLVPPDPEAQVVSRAHLSGGVIHGFEIRGVTKSSEAFSEVLHILSTNGISGYDITSQIVLLTTPRVKGEFEKRDAHQATIDFGNGLVSYSWDAKDDSEEEYMSQNVFEIGSTIEQLERVLQRLIKHDPRQWKKLVKSLEDKLDHELTENEQEILGNLLNNLHQVDEKRKIR